MHESGEKEVVGEKEKWMGIFELGASLPGVPQEKVNAPQGCWGIAPVDPEQLAHVSNPATRTAAANRCSRIHNLRLKRSSGNLFSFG